MSATPIQPYLMFGGRCQEALDFYARAVGAQVDMIMLFRDSPDPTPPGMLPPGFENKVMHSAFRIGGNTIMASDGCTEESTPFRGFSLSYTVQTEDDAHRIFNALAEGGQVQMALTKTFWSPCFGMLSDRFGIAWMIMVPGETS
ncbi:MAG: VOC family protein [Burkholderiaceae bacterium]